MTHIINLSSQKVKNLKITNWFIKPHLVCGIHIITDKVALCGKDKFIFGTVSVAKYTIYVSLRPACLLGASETHV